MDHIQELSSSSWDEMGDRGHNRHRPKRRRGAAVPLSQEGELGPRLTQCGMGRGLYFRTKWRLHPLQPFGRHGPKIGGLCPFWGGELGAHLTQSRLAGPRPTSIPSGILVHRAVWPQRTWAEKWGLCTFKGGELGPHNTMSPGPRPTSVPSEILILPAVWPGDMGRKLGGSVLFGEGSWVPI